MNITLISRPAFILPQGIQVREDQSIGQDAEQLIEFAGRVCYDSFGVGRSSDEFHEHILQVGHGSVLEHANFSFFVTGVSWNLMAEITRHRAGVAFSIRSTRYVDESDSPIAYHPLLARLFEEQPELRVMWDMAESQSKGVYIRTMNTLAKMLRNDGTDPLTAKKQSRGAARGILPSALETQIVWTANVREIRHIIEVRASDAADAEIRLLGNRVLEIMNEEVPAYFSDYDLSVPKDGVGLAVHTEYPKV